MMCTPPTAPEPHCAIRTEYSVGQVWATPNVVVEVCVCPPKVTKQCPAIPGVWGHCPQYPMAALAAEDVHTTV